MSWFYLTLGALFTLSIACCFYRLYLGPNLLNKVLALDFMGIAGIGILTSYAVWAEEPMILDLALVLALVSFVTALAFSRHISQQRGGAKK